MTGTGLSIITDNNKDSYNTAVNAINRHQKENVSKLERALVVANNNNDKLSDALSEVEKSISNLKRQAFYNQCLIDNWESTAPYSYPVDLLQ